MDQGQQLQKYISVDPLPPAVVFEEYDSPYALGENNLDGPPVEVTSPLRHSESGGIFYSSAGDNDSGSDGKLDSSM